MLGRRRRGKRGRHSGAGRAERDASSLTGGGLAPETPEPRAEPRADGPWDGSEQPPDVPRVDLGALLVPVAEGLEVQLAFVDDEVAAATVLGEEGTLQLQAFAAPKTGDLWAESRAEIASQLKEEVSPLEEFDGPFGPELRGEVSVRQPDGGEVSQQARFVGVDGPRWLLRGVLTGPKASVPHHAPILERVFRQVVVVRGEEPIPPRTRLELTMPATGDDQVDEGGQASDDFASTRTAERR